MKGKRGGTIFGDYIAWWILALAIIILMLFIFGDFYEVIVKALNYLNNLRSGR